MSGSQTDRASLSRLDLEPVISVLEELPGAVLLLDVAGTIRFMNRMAEERIDQTRGNAVGRDLFREVLPNLEREGLGERYRAGIRVHPTALRWESAIGSGEIQRPVSFRIHSCDSPGGVLGVVIVEDRSAIIQEVERRERAERLAAVGELAAGAAHEINNPLASIKGFAQLLARDTQDRGQQQALEIISQECSRVARVVDNLLDFATQQRVTSREEVDVSAIAESVLALKRYALETSGIAIEATLERGLSGVFAEKGGLQRLILILLCQAERSLHRSEGDRRLSIRSRETNEGVVLHVGDNGPGIPRHRLPFLLEATGVEESGSSLSNADAIAREHGGSLLVESAEGKGTTFTVRFPRSAARDRSFTAAPTVTVEPVVEPQPIRVLIADDEPTLRLALAMFLGRHGCSVDQAEDADQAYRMLRAGDFDVALVDVRMPGDGLVLLDRLDEWPEWRGQAILMTGDQTQTRVRQEIHAGRPHLTKPFDMLEAVRLIERLSGTPRTTGEPKLSLLTSS